MPVEMGFYERWILPRALDLSMRHRRLATYRQRILAAAQGTVLEVGIGSGLNLPYYRPAVKLVYAVDPSAELLSFAVERATDAACPVRRLRASAEALPIKSASVDTVVMTWTLCSIPDPLAALREMRRALRPGGRLLFVEHGLAPEPRVRRWQNWLTPCWKRIGGGCHLNRKMDDLIHAAGFEIRDLHTGYMKGPKPMTFMYEGLAHPAG
jgi:ubiquinone/menaquinone biosynthesis C-methylase UbiE